jgi:hypothetical protein
LNLSHGRKGEISTMFRVAGKLWPSVIHSPQSRMGRRGSEGARVQEGVVMSGEMRVKVTGTGALRLKAATIAARRAGGVRPSRTA